MSASIDGIDQLMWVLSPDKLAGITPCGRRRDVDLVAPVTNRGPSGLSW